MSAANGRPHITVVGDLILDRYLIGDATRLNPEMPGVVIRIDAEEQRLGGAAAVAMIAQGLGAHVSLAGVIGRDDSGDTLRRLIDKHEIEPHLWIDDRPTTWKQRIVSRGQLRTDRCDREVTTPIADSAADFLAAGPIGDVLLIQDYGKGVCTPRLLGKLVGRAHDVGIPVLVDPARSRGWSDYGEVTLIKANWSEATLQSTTNDASPMELARYLSDTHGSHVVITLGDQGLVCSERGGDMWHVPAAMATVRDVCGAGDTVLATLGAMVARGARLREACVLAVKVAAKQVSRVGIGGIPPIRDVA